MHDGHPPGSGDPATPGAGPYGAGATAQGPWGAHGAGPGPGGPWAHPPGWGAQGWQGAPPWAGFHGDGAAHHGAAWGARESFGPAGARGAGDGGLGPFRELLHFEDGAFWKGALVGAAAALLLTNEDLRGALLGGAARALDAFRSSAGTDEAGEPPEARGEGPAAGEQEGGA